MSEPSQKELTRQSRRIKQRLVLHFPWLSLAGSFVLIGYLITLLQPELIWPYSILEPFKSNAFQWLLVGLLILIVAWDLFFYVRRKKHLLIAINRLESEINNLWLAKKKIQQKAHLYSSHADKLKLFISDKLLEYIEYDEKYLHFKSIASEVRHNGVISYDKVRTALFTALKASQGELKQSESPSVTNDEVAESVASTKLYQQALDAQKYLWDLLDLSTADNIALHIANHLISCEEQYYQFELEDHKELKLSLLKDVCFSPMSALVSTFSSLIDAEEYEQLCSAMANHSVALQHFEIEHFRLGLEPCQMLLGNSNHFILLLENLIKNAQFFHGKRKCKQPSDKISVLLQQNSGYVEISVYNRGPHIDPELQEQIFQLGFSTRKAKEHHGKGLGLFFVNEIVKGYEGKIDIENIGNESQTLTLRMLTANNVVVTKVIRIVEQQGKVSVTEADRDHFQPQMVWEYAVPIVQVEGFQLNLIRLSCIFNIKLPCGHK
jgi:signal transduction histidine kinase